MNQSDRDEIRAIVREELARAKRRPAEAARGVADPMVEKLREAMARRPPYGREVLGIAWEQARGVSTGEVLRALGIPDAEHTRAMSMRAAGALRALGWALVARLGGCARRRVYLPSARGR